MKQDPLPHIPTPVVLRNALKAYRQGNSVHVIMETGWHYVYNDFNGYSSQWK